MMVMYDVSFLSCSVPPIPPFLKSFVNPFMCHFLLVKIRTMMKKLYGLNPHGVPSTFVLTLTFRLAMASPPSRRRPVFLLWLRGFCDRRVTTPQREILRKL